MSKEKMFHWLKMFENFFDRPEIRRLDNDEIVIYEKMLLATMNNEDHRITYRGIEKSLEEEIYFDLRLSERNVTVKQVRTLIDKGIRLGFITTDDPKTYICLPDLKTMVGSETASAGRMRKYRARKKAAAENEKEEDSVTSLHREEKELETDKEADIEKETDQMRGEQKVAYGRFKNVRLTPTQYSGLQQDFPNEYKQMIEHLSLYKEGHGVDYHNDDAVMRDWEEKDRREKQEKAQSQYTGMDADEIADTKKREQMLDDAWNDAMEAIWREVENAEETA